MMNIAQRAFNTPLLLDPAKAAVIVQTFGPRFLGAEADAPLHLDGAFPAASPAHVQPRSASLIGDEMHRALQQRGGGYSIIGGVAVISATGTLVRRGSWLGEDSSGATSYEGLSAQLRAAATDPEVRAIALEVDSFGGEAAGVFALMQLIRDVNAVKEVRAFIADFALSAGYAIASQASRITVPSFGDAGSIGVVMMHTDMSGKLSKEGIRVTFIHSGAKKVEGNQFEALPEAVREGWQRDCDQMRGRFAQEVALGRNGRVSVAQALATEAAVFTGADAVRVGLADEVTEARAAFEQFVDDMAETRPGARITAGPIAAETRTPAGVVLEVPPEALEYGATLAADGKLWQTVDINKVTAAEKVAGIALARIRNSTAMALPGSAFGVTEDSNFWATYGAQSSYCSPGCDIGAAAPQLEEMDMSKHVEQPVAKVQTAQGGDAPAADAVKTEVTPKAAGPDLVQAERDRAAKITDKVARAGLPASLGQKLIAEGVSLEDAYGQIVDARAESGADGGDIRNVATITGDARDRARTGMTKALLLKARLDGGERNEFTSMTLRELARASLQAQGIAAPVGGSMALASAAFAPAMAGGMHSTSDFSNILVDVANKSMLKGFMESPETFAQFTSTGTLTDFKATKRVGIDAFPSLGKVEEGAEFQYGTMGDHAETAMLATYGKLFAITRQTIINDDLDAFTKVPQLMGRAARRTVGDLVFAVLSANAVMSDGVALFHASHNNLAGSGAGPSESTINAGITAMTTQTDRSGNARLNISPKFLLAPPKYRSVVLQSLNSEYAPDDTAKAGTAKQSQAYNTTKDAADPIFDARLTGDEWYLLADPSMYDTIEVGYLDGIDTPFLDQQDGWSVDGTEFKVRIDAAATAVAWQAMYKNAGS